MSDVTDGTARRRATGRGSRAAVVAIALAAAALPTPAFAALGGQAASVDADRVHLQAALVRMTRVDAYAVHELQTASGTVVREYVSSGGTVFGVAWQGPWVPDLRTILGTYFDQYADALAAARTKRRGRGPLAVEGPGLVAELSGHPRAFSGRAYVPQLLPQGVTPESIR